MIVDNIDKLRKFLVFDDEKLPDWFYLIQIIARRKDTGTKIKKNSKLIRTYYVKSLAYFDEHVEQIKELCRIFNARAYIRINPSSWRKCVLHAFSELANYLNNDQCYAVNGLFDSLAEKYTANGVKNMWVIDIDTKDKGYLLNTVNLISECEPVGDKGVDLISTKNGYHYITHSFNIKQFNDTWNKRYQDECPGIHKNGSTLLYYESNEISD